MIYIPIYEKDLLTVDNLSDPSTPEMITNNIDIPPKFNLKKYDPTKYIKVRLICDYADSKWLKKCKNDEECLWEIENVFVDFHGGGFLIGNSNDHWKKVTSLFAKNFEGPIFSVDYRLLVNFWIENVDLHCPTVFQILIVLSILLEATCLLSAESEHDKICSPWTKKVTVFFLIPKSYNLSVLFYVWKSICISI